ncbi:hypothetical protein DL98DRAFT_643636 [Cadophora sp. DSE1049]|nr:hypothetical protein DL98DRAFT_643636 [Cadophora sp. DSE1049]
MSALVALTTAARLTSDRNSWPLWLSEFKAQALIRGSWKHVNPSGPTAPHVPSTEPTLPPSINELLEIENKILRSEWEDDVSEQKPKNPKVARFADIKEEHTYRLREYQVQHAQWSSENVKYQALFDWVRLTVDLALIEPHRERLIVEDKWTLQNLVRALQLKYAPTEEATKEYIRNEYRRVLELPTRPGAVAPLVWLNDWFQALSRAQVRGLVEITEGFTAKKEFLQVVFLKLAPEWGRNQLQKATEADAMREPTRSLEEYGRILKAHLQAGASAPTKAISEAYSSVYTTLGGRSDGTAPHLHRCPCFEDLTARHQ